MIDQIWSISSTPAVGVNGARNAELLFAIRVKKRVVCRVDGLTAILAGKPRNHGPPSTISRDRHPDPNHGRKLVRFDQFSLSPSVRVNGSANSELLFAISVKKMAVWRVDGLAAIFAGSPRNHGPPSAIFRTRHPDPNHGRELIRFGQFSVPPR